MSLPPQVIVPTNGHVSSIVNSFQIWACTECTRLRQWGFGRPDPECTTDPLLRCTACYRQTRHSYSQLVVSRKRLDIDFGEEVTWRMPKENKQ